MTDRSAPIRMPNIELNQCRHEFWSYPENAIELPVSVVGFKRSNAGHVEA